LPVIVELIAGRGRIDLIIPRISGMMGSGMITLGTVKVSRRLTDVERREMHGYLH
jgi:PII-like signaling protein